MIEFFHQQVCRALDQALALYQSQQPVAGERLQRYQNQALKLQLKELPQPIWLVCTAQRLVLSSEQSHADCTLTTSLFTLPKLRERSQITALIKSGELDMTGDVQLAQVLAGMLQDVRWEPEQALSQWVGEVPAHMVWQPLRRMGHWLNRQQREWRLNTTELLQDEVRVMPHPLEVQHFLDEVDKLEAATSQLETRIDAMVQSKQGKQS